MLRRLYQKRRAAARTQTLAVLAAAAGAARKTERDAHDSMNELALAAGLGAPL